MFLLLGQFFYVGLELGDFLLKLVLEVLGVRDGANGIIQQVELFLQYLVLDCVETLVLLQLVDVVLETVVG